MKYLFAVILAAYSSQSFATMERVNNYKKQSDTLAAEATELGKAIAFQDGDIVGFIRNEQLTSKLRHYDINFFPCYSPDAITSACLDKLGQNKLAKTIGALLIESQANYNIYMRALKAINSKETRVKMYNEIQKQKDLRHQLTQQLATEIINSKAEFENATKDSPIKKALPLLVNGRDEGRVWVLLPMGAAVLILLVGIVTLSGPAFIAGLIAVSLGIGVLAPAKGYIQQRDSYRNANAQKIQLEIQKLEKQISDESQFAEIVDQAILESLNKSNLP